MERVKFVWASVKPLQVFVNGFRTINGHMTNIILDTNIIITYPKLLGLTIPDITFIVPIDVIIELNSRAQLRGKNYDDRVDLIEKGANQGTVSILNTDLPAFKKYHEAVKSVKIAGADIAIIATALTFLEKNEIAKIATLDREIITIAKEQGIEILPKEEIEELLLKFEKPIDKKAEFKEFLEVLFEALVGIFPFFYLIKILLKPLINLKKIEIPSIQGKILFFERKETASLVAGILIGAFLMLIAILIYFNLGSITETINIWGTILLILLCGIILFIFREKQRFSYGVFEFLVGAFSIILLFLSDDFDYQKIKFNLDFSIKLLAGMYIMVRGQDNIVRSLKDTKVGIKLKKYGIGI
jgi:hypothetical protein